MLPPAGHVALPWSCVSGGPPYVLAPFRSLHPAVVDAVLDALRVGPADMCSSTSVAVTAWFWPRLLVAVRLSSVSSWTRFWSMRPDRRVLVLSFCTNR